MEAALFIWFAGVVGSVGHLLGWVAFFTIIGTLGAYVFRMVSWSDEYKDERGPKPSFKTHAWVLVLGLFVALTSALMPDQKTMYLAGGAYIGQKVVQSETSDKVMKLVNTKLDEYIAEVEEEARKAIEKAKPSKGE